MIALQYCGKHDNWFRILCGDCKYGMPAVKNYIPVESIKDSRCQLPGHTYIGHGEGSKFCKKIQEKLETE